MIHRAMHTYTYTYTFIHKYVSIYQTWPRSTQWYTGQPPFAPQTAHTHTHTHTHAHARTHTHTHARSYQYQRWMRHISYMKKSCHKHEKVMSHIWRSHVARMKTSCHIHEWVMSHTYMSHVTHMKESHDTCDESCPVEARCTCTPRTHQYFKRVRHNSFTAATWLIVITCLLRAHTFLRVCDMTHSLL